MNVGLSGVMCEEGLEVRDEGMDELVGLMLICVVWLV